MKITDFKKGDIITRMAPVKCVMGFDQSLIGNRFVFHGVDKKSKMIFLINTDYGVKTEQLSYAVEAWDKGWELWPEKLSKEASKEAEKLSQETEKKKQKE